VQSSRKLWDGNGDEVCCVRWKRKRRGAFRLASIHSPAVGCTLDEQTFQFSKVMLIRDVDLRFAARCYKLALTVLKRGFFRWLDTLTFFHLRQLGRDLWLWCNEVVREDKHRALRESTGARHSIHCLPSSAVMQIRSPLGRVLESRCARSNT